jgi:hypothetical protein
MSQSLPHRTRMYPRRSGWLRSCSSTTGQALPAGCALRPAHMGPQPTHLVPSRHTGSVAASTMAAAVALRSRWCASAWVMMTSKTLPSAAAHRRMHTAACPGQEVHLPAWETPCWDQGSLSLEGPPPRLLPWAALPGTTLILLLWQAACAQPSARLPSRTRAAATWLTRTCCTAG